MINHLKNKTKIILFIMALFSTGLVTEASLINNQPTIDELLNISAGTEKTKDDKGYENEEDSQVDNNPLWNPNYLRQDFFNLHKFIMMDTPLHQPFTTLFPYFRQHMRIGDSLWGGTKEIKKIANKLQVPIQEYTPAPDNHNKLTEILPMGCQQYKPFLQRTPKPRYSMLHQPSKSNSIPLQSKNIGLSIKSVSVASISIITQQKSRSQRRDPSRLKVMDTTNIESIESMLNRV